MQAPVSLSNKSQQQRVAQLYCCSCVSKLLVNNKLEPLELFKVISELRNSSSREAFISALEDSAFYFNVPLSTWTCVPTLQTMSSSSSKAGSKAASSPGADMYHSALTSPNLLTHGTTATGGVNGSSHANGAGGVRRPSQFSADFSSALASAGGILAAATGSAVVPGHHNPSSGGPAHSASGRSAGGASASDATGPSAPAFVPCGVLNSFTTMIIVNRDVYEMIVDLVRVALRQANNAGDFDQISRIYSLSGRVGCLLGPLPTLRTLPGRGYSSASGGEADSSAGTHQSNSHSSLFNMFSSASASSSSSMQNDNVGGVPEPPSLTAASASSGIVLNRSYASCTLPLLPSLIEHEAWKNPLLWLDCLDRWYQHDVRMVAQMRLTATVPVLEAFFQLPVQHLLFALLVNRIHALVRLIQSLTLDTTESATSSGNNGARSVERRNRGAARPNSALVSEFISGAMLLFNMPRHSSSAEEVGEGGSGGDSDSDGWDADPMTSVASQAATSPGVASPEKTPTGVVSNPNTHGRVLTGTVVYDPGSQIGSAVGPGSHGRDSSTSLSIEMMQSPISSPATAAASPPANDGIASAREHQETLLTTRLPLPAPKSMRSLLLDSSLSPAYCLWLLDCCVRFHRHGLLFDSDSMHSPSPRSPSFRNRNGGGVSLSGKLSSGGPVPSADADGDSWDALRNEAYCGAVNECVFSIGYAPAQNLMLALCKSIQKLQFSPSVDKLAALGTGSGTVASAARSSDAESEDVDDDEDEANADSSRCSTPIMKRRGQGACQVQGEDKGAGSSGHSRTSSFSFFRRTSKTQGGKGEAKEQTATVTSASGHSEVLSPKKRRQCVCCRRRMAPFDSVSQSLLGIKIMHGDSPAGSRSNSTASAPAATTTGKHTRKNSFSLHGRGASTNTHGGTSEATANCSEATPPVNVTAIPCNTWHGVCHGANAEPTPGSALDLWNQRSLAYPKIVCEYCFRTLMVQSRAQLGGVTEASSAVACVGKCVVPVIGEEFDYYSRHGHAGGSRKVSARRRTSASTSSRSGSRSMSRSTSRCPSRNAHSRSNSGNTSSTAAATVIGVGSSTSMHSNLHSRDNSCGSAGRGSGAGIAGSPRLSFCTTVNTAAGAGGGELSDLLKPCEGEYDSNSDSNRDGSVSGDAGSSAYGDGSSDSDSGDSGYSDSADAMTPRRVRNGRRNRRGRGHRRRGRSARTLADTDDALQRRSFSCMYATAPTGRGGGPAAARDVENNGCCSDAAVVECVNTTLHNYNLSLYSLTDGLSAALLEAAAASASNNEGGGRAAAPVEATSPGGHSSGSGKGASLNSTGVSGGSGGVGLGIVASAATAQYGASSQSQSAKSGSIAGGSSKMRGAFENVSISNVADAINHFYEDSGEDNEDDDELEEEYGDAEVGEQGEDEEDDDEYGGGLEDGIYFDTVEPLVSASGAEVAEADGSGGSGLRPRVRTRSRSDSTKRSGEVAREDSAVAVSLSDVKLHASSTEMETADSKNSSAPISPKVTITAPAPVVTGTKSKSRSNGGGAAPAGGRGDAGAASASAISAAMRLLQQQHGGGIVVRKVCNNDMTNQKLRRLYISTDGRFLYWDSNTNSSGGGGIRGSMGASSGSGAAAINYKHSIYVPHIHNVSVGKPPYKQYVTITIMDKTRRKKIRVVSADCSSGRTDGCRTEPLVVCIKDPESYAAFLQVLLHFVHLHKQNGS